MTILVGLCLLTVLFPCSLPLWAGPIDSDLAKRALLEPHDPQDRLFEEINLVAERAAALIDTGDSAVLNTLLQLPYYQRPDGSDIAGAFLELVQAHPGPNGFGRPSGRRARAPLSTPSCMSATPQRGRLALGLVLILEADRLYQDGDGDGQRFLHAAALLWGRHYQNTELDALEEGLEGLRVLADYMLNHMPTQFLNAEMTNWFPTWPLLKESMQQALFHAIVKNQKVVMSGFRRRTPSLGLKDRFIEESRFFLGFDKKQTRKHFEDLFDDFVKGMDSLADPHLERTLKYPSSDWFLANTIGENLVYDTGSILNKFPPTAAMTAVMRDVLAIHIETSRVGGRLTSDELRRFLTEAEAVNPFTGDSYLVNDAGLVELLPEPEAHHRHCSSSMIRRMEPFTLILDSYLRASH